MKPFLLLFTVLASASLYAQDWTGRHLQKLYARDPEKCLQRSEWLADRFPNAAAPRFYAGKVQLERLPQARNLKARYTTLSKVIVHARAFEKKAPEAMLTLYAWPEFLQTLNDSCAVVAKELKQEHETALYKKLVAAWDKLADGRDELTAIDYHPAPDERTSDKKPATTAQKSTAAAPQGLYFGLPDGTENLPSWSVSEEKAVLILINQERRRLKMDTLTWDDDLARACRYHANDMAKQGYFMHDSHDLVNGRHVEVANTFDRIRQFYSASFVNGENIAAGNGNAEGTYDQWYNSPGHYDNMFNRSSRKAAIGVAYDPESPWRYYWVFCTAL